MIIGYYGVSVYAQLALYFKFTRKNRIVLEFEEKHFYISPNNIENMKKIVTSILAVLAFCFGVNAQAVYPVPDLTVKLWPNGAPTSNGITEAEYDYGDHVTNVTEPTLSIWIPENPCGLAIISTPGGGYRDVWDKTEGYSLAEWYMSMGIVYAVLKYRLPNGNKEVPLDDIQEAMRIMRSHADEYGFKYLGVQGNSAGGHLSAMASTHYTNALNRPDFTILFYPVVTLDSSYTHRGTQVNLLGMNASKELIDAYSNEKCVTPDTPPAYIMHATDDNLVPVRNAIEYYNALLANGVKYSAMNIIPSGGHGWTDREFIYRKAWMNGLQAWLEGLKDALDNR